MVVFAVELSVFVSCCFLLFYCYRYCSLLFVVALLLEPSSFVTASCYCWLLLLLIFVVLLLELSEICLSLFVAGCSYLCCCATYGLLAISVWLLL